MKAVAIARDNPAFQEVRELGFSGDLVRAGSSQTRPVQCGFLSARSSSSSLEVSVRLMWLRLAASPPRSSTSSSGGTTGQRGLDLVRDARLEWTGVFTQAARLAGENAGLNARIETLAQTRLSAGDVSELEVINARMGSILTRDEVLRSDRDYDVATTRMRGVLGLTATATVIVLPDLPQETPPPQSLLRSRWGLAARQTRES